MKLPSALGAMSTIVLTLATAPAADDAVTRPAIPLSGASARVAEPPDGLTVTLGTARSILVARSVKTVAPNAAAIPGEPQLRQLAEDTLMLWHQAIQNGGDFSALYAAASDRWKYRGRTLEELTYTGTDPVRRAKADPDNRDNRLTVIALKNAFADPVAAKVDISSIRGKKMIPTEPARVNSNGVLILDGTFDSPVFAAATPEQPRRVKFILEYVHEAELWKLFGITVNILAADK